jgi:aspartate aminotransferase-like enzyme
MSSLPRELSYQEKMTRAVSEREARRAYYESYYARLRSWEQVMQEKHERNMATSAVHDSRG